MTAASTHRSKDRSASVLLRFSEEDREQLKQRARELGMTVQDYADLKLLDRAVPAAPRVSGRRKHASAQREELPLTG